MNRIPAEFCQIGPGSWLAADALPTGGKGIDILDQIAGRVLGQVAA